MSTQKCDTPRVNRKECACCCKNAKRVECHWCDGGRCVVCQKDCCNTYAYKNHENEITCWKCHIQDLSRIDEVGKKQKTQEA